jgi:hypothetical protein
MRTARNMAFVDSTHALHGARVDWAVCAYDDRKDDWQPVWRSAAALNHSRLITVMNHNDSSPEDPPGMRPLKAGQRKARMVLHRRLVRSAWAIAGRDDAWDAVWLPDDDLRFDLFDLKEFLMRWTCALPGGPPVVSQPPINQHGVPYERAFGKSWPANSDTYQLCLRGGMAASFGARDACFLRDALAIQSGFVENQAALVDARFLSWFWNQSLTVRIGKAQLRLKAETGPDAIWCGAAAEWIVSLQQSQRVACAVIAVQIGHDDQRSLDGRRASHFARGFGVLDVARVRSSLWRMQQPLIVNNKTVGCRRTACTRHRWFLYQPVPGWTIPDDEWGLRQVRACTLTKEDVAADRGRGAQRGPERVTSRPAACHAAPWGRVLGSHHDRGHDSPRRGEWTASGAALSTAHSSSSSSSSSSFSSSSFSSSSFPSCDMLQALYWRANEI